ncbi:hypothetical protein ISM_05400 [Roseovarius nubinhibens ISM]|uniref:Uncharacterized protein n=1 Tax=Roseovarius nubinhibens (strain ATCC BAA-591 / DSM 15170 / ISM) TaxID=89187 RepID=A3SK22_ROSNI|nr:hypothetical protein ISM_05400 [Roseovarius nubinhibens ISM]
MPNFRLKNPHVQRPAPRSDHPRTKGKRGAPKDAPPNSRKKNERLAAVVHAELDRVRRVFVKLDLFHLQSDIAVDLVFGEHVTGEQIVVIGLQLFHGFAQAATDGGDAFELFGRQVVEVLVHGFAGVDLGLDTVEAGHQQRGKGEVGVRRRIGEAGLDAFCLGALGPWDPDAARPVAGRIGAQNGGFETGDQTLVAVGRRVGEGVERLGVLEDTADEIQRLLAQVGIFVASKERLAVFPDRHVHMHAGAVVAGDRLGHEGCRLAIGVGHVVDHVFVFLQLVGLFGQAVEDQAKLVLARGHFVVMLVDLHAQTFHRREHFRTDVLRVVDRVHREVAALDAGTMAHVAHLVFGVRVPGSVLGVDLIGDLVDRVREAHVVEEEKLRLGAHVGHVADARGLEIGFGLFGGAARVALIGFAGVGLDHRAMHAEGFLGIEGIDIGAVGVDHQLHVGGFDAFPASDRRAVEHKAFLEEVFVHLVGHQRHVLKLAARVGETNVDIFDVLVLDHLEQVSCAHNKISSG